MAINKRHIKRGLVAIVITIAISIGCTTPSAAAKTIDGIELYRKNLQPEHKLKLANDIERYQSADNLWDVLRDQFSLPHYENHPLVQDKIIWYLNNQVYLLRAANRAAPFLYYISQEVKKRHLPAELVLLPIIESGYDPFSLSNVGAAGIWQLMPGTATGLGIRQDWWYDGRRDIIASTRAALNHLVYLENFFDGNWLLAIAAYNTGEGNVMTAIKRNIRNGKDTDFWSLPVAQQTRDYVPSLLALAAIISHPERYPLYLPAIKNAPYLAQVDVGTQINLRSAAVLAGLTFKTLQRLNPGYTQAATSSKGPYKIVLPIESVAAFTDNLLKNPSAANTTWTKYSIKSGDTLISIAKRFQVSVISLRKMNELRSHILRPGSSLLIPIQDKKLASPLEGIERLATKESVSQQIKNIHERAKLRNTYNEAKYRLTAGDTIYMVRNSDTLLTIAKKFHVDKLLLQKINQLHGEKVIAGEKIVVPTHVSNLPTKLRIHTHDTLYMVKAGDTVEKIAAKFKTTPAAIRLANLIDNNSLEVGEKLVVPTHLQG